MKLVSNGKILFERWDLAGSQRQEGFPVWAFRPDGARALLCFTSKAPKVVRLEEGETIVKEYLSNSGRRYADVLTEETGDLRWERIPEERGGELFVSDHPVMRQVGYWLITGEWPE